MIESQSKVDIDTTDFFGLKSNLTASAISVNDGQDKSVTIKTSSFVNNTSGQGVIALSTSTMVIEDSFFYDNAATQVTNGF